VNNKLAVPNSMTEQKLDGGSNVMFRHTVPYEQMEGTYQYIYGLWLFENNAELRDCPGFCHYHQLDPSQIAPSDLISDIYIPNKKQA
jgi:DNA gyrase inhibitor GyrI